MQISIAKPMPAKKNEDDRKVKITVNKHLDDSIQSRQFQKSPSDNSIVNLKGQLKLKSELQKADSQLKDFISNPKLDKSYQTPLDSMINKTVIAPISFENQILKVSDHLHGKSQILTPKTVDVSLNFQSNNLSKDSTAEMLNDDQSRLGPRPFKKNSYQNFMSNPTDMSISELVEKNFEQEKEVRKKIDNRVQSDVVFADPPLKSDFLFGNLPITVDKKDSSTYKIEALRKYLEDVIGLDVFLEIYVGIKDQNDAKQYPTQSEKFLPLVHQLIFLEDKVFLCSQ